MIHFNDLEKQQKTKSKIKGRKDIAQFRAEISEKETKVQMINEIELAF